MNICVFGSASDRIDNSFIAAVDRLGYEIGKRGHNLVFGGGGCGLMGAAARGTARGGGKIYGVVPEFFLHEDVEELYEYCTEMILTDTMQERKLKMEELADAFIIVPGGIGTMEEFFEVLTHKQLGVHDKPIAIYNVNGYYDLLERFIFNMKMRRFVKASCDFLYLTANDLDEMFDYITHAVGSLGLGLKDYK